MMHIENLIILLIIIYNIKKNFLNICFFLSISLSMTNSISITTLKLANIKSNNII